MKKTQYLHTIKYVNIYKTKPIDKYSNHKKLHNSDKVTYKFKDRKVKDDHKISL